jgi:phospholipid transport system substrate-binding protein
MSNRLSAVWVAAIGLLAASVMAQPEVQSTAAYDLVEATTVQVMEVVLAAEEYVEDEPERYYDQVQALLDPLIDYRGFSRQVMGPYASSKRYRSLDEAERKQLREQLDRFTEVMRLSLVRTYSKGLLAFGSARIEVEVPEAQESAASRLSVKQLIYTDDEVPYVVLYQMGQGKTGDWMLRNVIIESVNLGEIYRDQFLASARKLDGDLDAVIDSWTTVTVDVES